METLVNSVEFRERTPSKRAASNQEIKAKISKLDSLCVTGFEKFSDEDLRRMRREDRYSGVTSKMPL